MRYLVDITPKHAQLIQKQLDKGNYSSLSQFISTAVENQLALEENDLQGLVPYQPIAEDVKTDYTVSKRNVQINYEKYRLINISGNLLTIVSPEFKDLVFASQEDTLKTRFGYGDK